MYGFGFFIITILWSAMYGCLEKLFQLSLVFFGAVAAVSVMVDVL